jgi:hypothetical protein
MRVDQGTGQREAKPVGTDALTRHRFLPSRAGVIELVVLFVLLIAIERLIMSPGDFAKLQPHPYWLPVILLSLQYGTADGVLAAAVAILVSMATGWPSQGVGEEYYRYIVRVWAVPITWIMMSILIGEVRARQRSQIVELKRDLVTTRDQAEGITSHCYKLEDKIQRLEREFATVEASSLDTLVAALQDLRRGDPRAWPETLARAHRGLVGSGTIEVLLRTERAYFLVAQSAIADGKGPAVAAGGQRGDGAAFVLLLDKVMAGRRALSAQNVDDAIALDGLAAMALPLAMTVAGSGPDGAEPTSRIIGVLLVETLPPERLNVDTENRLEVLAREVSQALASRGYDDLIEAATPIARIGLSRADAAWQDQPGENTASTEPAARRIGLFPRFGRA